MGFAVSVVICTHNPRADYLQRTLDGLKAQVLPKEQWELLLVDNHSKEPVAAAFDLSWHPNGRHVREDQLGLTNARLCGIRESTADLIVFCDDDNVLAPDYLSTALNLSVTRNCVGAFGGNITGEFETQPESWVDIMYSIFAVVSVKDEIWICSPGTTAQHLAPCGSGMVIRRKIAEYWAKLSASDPLRRGLGRKGASLAGAEDMDMSLCSCVLGMAVGRFPQLQLTHLIPTRRVQREYLLRLMEEATFSDAVLQYVWNKKLPGDAPVQMSGSEKLFRNMWTGDFIGVTGGIPSFNYQHMQARNRGLARATQVLTSENGVAKPQ